MTEGFHKWIVNYGRAATANEKLARHKKWVKMYRDRKTTPVFTLDRGTRGRRLTDASLRVFECGAFGRLQILTDILEA